MLAVVLDDAHKVNAVYDAFTAVHDCVFVACAGTPAENGIAQARGKASVIIFETTHEMDEAQKDQLLQLGVFNITARQASRSVNHRTGYFAKSTTTTAQDLLQIMDVVHTLVRLKAERLRIVAQLSAAPQSHYSDVPATPFTSPVMAPMPDFVL